MYVYLPIAEMSVNVLVLLGLGAAVGFLSGLFGVGGGFLMTPLLMFLGVPPAVAVATGTAHVVASSVSGAITQYRRNNVDVKMGLIMCMGGLVGTSVGVETVRVLRRAGQFDLIISLTYVTFLGVIGALMLIESINTWRKAQAGVVSTGRQSGQHSWVDGLPFKMRFHRSKLYISAIPPICIGMFVGFMAAVMGIGGGFVIIPAMIYLLRMSTSVVVGTSLFQIVFVAALATVLHAMQNKTVDVMLALVLMAGGVLGAQYGTTVGEKIRGDHWRFSLAVLVLAVCLRMGYDLVAAPSDLYSFGGMHRGP
ncbi:MAG: sulfite exporter TauE/SafE family protein [Hyphomicrobiaceae bacterium]|nr:sulfite exporter TauE/SafE family protein [Hyphomicrobiaceae bacterium]